MIEITTEDRKAICRAVNEAAAELSIWADMLAQSADLIREGCEFQGHKLMFALRALRQIEAHEDLNTAAAKGLDVLDKCPDGADGSVSGKPVYEAFGPNFYAELTGFFGSTDDPRMQNALTNIHRTLEALAREGVAA